MHTKTSSNYSRLGVFGRLTLFLIKQMNAVGYHFMLQNDSFQSPSKRNFFGKLTSLFHLCITNSSQILGMTFNTIVKNRSKRSQKKSSIKNGSS